MSGNIKQGYSWYHEWSGTAADDTLTVRVFALPGMYTRKGADNMSAKDANEWFDGFRSRFDGSVYVDMHFVRKTN